MVLMATLCLENIPNITRLAFCSTTTKKIFIDFGWMDPSLSIPDHALKRAFFVRALRWPVFVLAGVCVVTVIVRGRCVVRCRV